MQCAALGFVLIEQTSVFLNPGALDAVRDLGFVLIDRTSPLSLRLKIKARAQHDPHSRNEGIECCSVLVWDSCWLN